jgi:2,3-dihydroxybenzoate decarboxylase
MTELLRQIPQNLPSMKKNVTTYFHTNIYETTSGNFATELLKFHINQIGLDRIMHSIDYPWVSLRSLLVFFFFHVHNTTFMIMSLIPVGSAFLLLLYVLKELMSDGATWINSLSSVLTKENLDSLRREVAIKVLRLNE